MSYHPHITLREMGWPRQPLNKGKTLSPDPHNWGKTSLTSLLPGKVPSGQMAIHQPNYSLVDADTKAYPSSHATSQRNLLLPAQGTKKLNVYTQQLTKEAKISESSPRGEREWIQHHQRRIFWLGGATLSLGWGCKEGSPALRLAWHCPCHRARPFRELHALNPPALHTPV